MSAYQTVADAVEGVLPSTWKFTPYEPTEDLPDVTGVTLKIRAVNRHPGAPGRDGVYLIDWVITITSPNTSRESADPALYDDLIDFLAALDTIGPWLTWKTTEKTVGDDLTRLAYDITVSTMTQKGAA